MIIKSNSALYPQYYKHFTRLSPKEFLRFKKRILELVRSGHINTKDVVNKGTKILIAIPKKSIEHSLSFAGTLAKAKSLTVIRELLKTAFLVGDEPDKSDSRKSVFKFKNTVNVDGQIWRVTMYVKLSDNGRFYYHHDLSTFQKNT